MVFLQLSSILWQSCLFGASDHWDQVLNFQISWSAGSDLPNFHIPSLSNNHINLSVLIIILKVVSVSWRNSRDMDQCIWDRTTCLLEQKEGTVHCQPQRILGRASGSGRWWRPLVTKAILSLAYPKLCQKLGKSFIVTACDVKLPKCQKTINKVNKYNPGEFFSREESIYLICKRVPKSIREKD